MNKLRNKRVQSFTLVEVIIVFILSSIVTILSAWFFLMVFKYMVNLDRDLKEDNLKYRFINMLDDDFRKSDYIIYKQFTYYISKNDTVVCTYSVDDNMFIRETKNSADTLYDVSEEVETTYFYSIRGEKYIKSMSFGINIENSSFHVYLYKDYYDSFMYNLNYRP